MNLIVIAGFVFGLIAIAFANARAYTTTAWLGVFILRYGGGGLAISAYIAGFGWPSTTQGVFVIVLTYLLVVVAGRPEHALPHLLVDGSVRAAGRIRNARSTRNCPEGEA